MLLSLTLEQLLPADLLSLLLLLQEPLFVDGLLLLFGFLLQTSLRVLAPVRDQFLGSALGDEKLRHAQVVSLRAIFLILEERGHHVRIFFVLVRGRADFVLFALELGLLRFYPSLGLRVRVVNDSQGQVQKEERADEDEGDEEEKDKGRVRLLVHDHDV